MERRSPFPADIAGEIYAHDPIGPGDGHVLFQKVDSAFGVLNQLAAAVFDKAKTDKLDLTAVQTWVVMRDFQRKVKKYGGCPADLNEVRAMSLNVADYDINEIKILQRKLTPFEAKDLA